MAPPRLRTVLVAGAVLYCGVQWVAASRIGGSPVFPLVGRASTADRRAAVASLVAALRSECPRGAHTVLFDDEDALLPFVPERPLLAATCTLTRETPVTPFRPEQLDRCDALLVRELVPGRKGDAAADPAPPAGRGTRPWQQRALWTSPDGRYGVAVYGHACAANSSSSSSASAAEPPR